jgi:hypothetical protein
MGHLAGVKGVESCLMCPSCKDLNIEFIIRFPSDLRQAIAVTRDNLADGTISDVTTDGDGKPFHELSSSGKWDDVLHYRFQCISCGQLFELHAETYHGSGGWWKPVE